MLGATVSKALYARLDRAEPKTIVYVRLEGMPHDVRAV
jgi:hypothetical protein